MYAFGCLDFLWECAAIYLFNNLIICTGVRRVSYLIYIRLQSNPSRKSIENSVVPITAKGLITLFPSLLNEYLLLSSAGITIITILK